MKLFVLALFSLILVVRSEEEANPVPVLEVQSESVQASPDQASRPSVYETIYADYYNQRGNYNNKKYNRNQGEYYDVRNFKDYDAYNNGYKLDDKKIIGYVGYIKPEQFDGYQQYQYRLMGRTGLGFDKRTATSYGLKAPITPQLLDVVGKRYYQKNNKYNYDYS